MSPLLLAVVLALLIGVTLGLLGGGGSILAVPVFVYALSLPEKTAIASSLVLVGTTSALAALAHARRGRVVWRAAVPFAAGSMAAAFAGGALARHVPAGALLTLFALVMTTTAAFMWRGRAAQAVGQTKTSRLALAGAAVGALTGLAGAGGGFLVVPALTLWGGLALPQAIATSLLIIALNSAAGFVGYASHVDVPWGLTALATTSAVLGSAAGTALGEHVPQAQLRKGFALFVLVAGLMLLAKQLLAG